MRSKEAGITSGFSLFQSNKWKQSNELGYFSWLVVKLKKKGKGKDMTSDKFNLRY